jgi:hypothetical protein
MALNMDTENRWAVNEDLANSYRELSVSSQSFLLAVGAILLSENNFWLVLIISVVALVIIWWLFFRIIYVRSIITDYYKYEMSNLFGASGDAIAPGDKALRENDYVRNAKLRRKVNGLMPTVSSKWDRDTPFGNLRATRFKLDVALPALFTLIWLVFVVYTAVKYF